MKKGTDGQMSKTSYCSICLRPCTHRQHKDQAKTRVFKMITFTLVLLILVGVDLLFGIPLHSLFVLHIAVAGLVTVLLFNYLDERRKNRHQ